MQQIQENKRKCKSFKDFIEIHYYTKTILSSETRFATDHDIFQFIKFQEKEDFQEYIALVDIRHSIQDEWKITEKMMDLTSQNDSSCEIFDEDGQFLLSECSEILPIYISPENDAHKVFIKNGNIYFNEISCLNPLLIDKIYLNEDMTKKIKCSISKNHHLFTTHRTIGYLPIQITNFLNENIELFGKIINLFIDGLIPSKFQKEETILKKLSEPTECQLCMNTIQFNRYYNFISQSNETTSYCQKLGEILTDGFIYLITQGMDTLYPININEYHSPTPNYKELFENFILMEHSKEQPKELIEDKINNIELNDILEEYKDILFSNELETIISEDINDVLSIDSDIFGFVGKSDGLSQCGDINTNKFDELIDELIDDLEQSSSNEEDDDDILGEEDLIGQLTNLLKKTNDSTQTPFVDSLCLDPTTTTSTLLGNAMK